METPVVEEPISDSETQAPGRPMIEEAKEADWSDEDDPRPKSKPKKRSSPNGPNGPNGRGGQREVDPLVAIMMKEEVIKVCSTLIAKLELIRFDEERTTVFKTPWAQGLFQSCLKRLAPETMMDFDIQNWYNDVVSKSQKAGRGRGTDYRFSPALTTQAVQTNWLMPLFEQEMQAPGFMLLLYNTLELEDQTHQKMATGAKEETEYNWIQSGSMSKPMPLCIGGVPRSDAPKMLTNGRK